MLIIITEQRNEALKESRCASQRRIWLLDDIDKAKDEGRVLDPIGARNKGTVLYSIFKAKKQSMLMK